MSHVYSPDQHIILIAAHNAEVYGVADHITFIQADFLSWSTAYSQDPSNQPVDAVYLSPPWGGLNYLLPGGEYSLDQLQPPGAEIMTAARRLSNNIALFIPRNSSLSDISSLGSGEVEVEEVFMSGKLKALTAYYGDLSRRK